MKETIKNKPLVAVFKNIKNFFIVDKWMSAAIFLSFLIFYISTVFFSGSGLLTSGVKLSDYETGKVAEKDIIVDRDIEYKDEKATQLKREAQALLIPPVFRVTESISDRVMSSYNKFMNLYLKLINADKSSSEIYLEIQSALPGFFTEDQVELLLEVNDPLNLLYDSRDLISSMMLSGVISIPENLRISGDTVEILKWSNGEKVSEKIEINKAVSIENLKQRAVDYFNFDDLVVEKKEFILILLSVFIEENAFYDAEQTDENRERAREQVAPVIKKIVKDEVIVKKGFIITEENMIKVEALGTYSDNFNITIFLGKLLLLLILFIIAFNLFKPPVLIETPAKSRMFLILSLFSIFFVIASLITRYIDPADGLPAAVFVPIALITMLISILVNTRTGIFSAVVLSFSLFLLPGDQISNFIFTFVSGVFGSLIVYKAEHRITLIKAGVIISLINAGVIVTLALINNVALTNFLDTILIAIANGFLCGVFTLGLLPILEHMLNAPTPFRLMELSDLNTPLFKRMLILAPGTYSHSVSVANLAETAAKEIGANALLARVGAYYHDIGKIDQAEYFIENQKSGNKHDELKATLSTAVIKSHVKIGYEKAKELGLPDEVMQIISQHHGSGKISYFYMKALNEQKADQKLSPEDFSYTGTPPVSREAAVVMLADTVEAATRTLKNPTMSKLERFVWDLILEKVSSGQMRNSGLTFNDLETIKNSFVQILGGSYHTRIEYPGQNDKKEKDE